MFREISPSVSAAQSPNGPAARCRNLIKRFADANAVNGIDLEVHTGECFGLLGPNGAGKTTTVEIFEGLTAPTAGSVEMFGRAWDTGHDKELRQVIGVQLQETQLAEKLTVTETLRLFRSFYARGHDVNSLIRLVELEGKRDTRIGGLSGGQRQRLAVACALVNDPKLLFLDEPTNGLDPQMRLKVWDVIETFRRAGRTVILTTHYMEEAARLCDRVAIMDQGRVIALGPPAILIAALGADQIVEFRVTGEVSEEALMNLDGVRGVHSTQQTWHHEAANPSEQKEYAFTVTDIGLALPALLHELERQRARLIALTTHQATLEDVFVSLTGRKLEND